MKHTKRKYLSLLSILTVFTLSGCDLVKSVNNMFDGNGTSQKENDNTSTSEVVPVTSLTLNKTELELVNGESEALTFTILPSNATNQNVSWTSGDERVVTVINGLVKAVGEGSTTVTARVDDQSAVCNVKVLHKEVKVTGISVDFEDIFLKVGGEQTLNPTVSPSDADDKTVTYFSSDENIATVNNSGKVVAVSVGNAVITITTKDGGYTATCNVSVSEDIPEAESVSLNYDSLAMEVGEQRTLRATLSPYNASTEGISWSSSDSSVASVEGGTVIALAAGTTEITVETSNHKTASCSVSVTNSSSEDQYVPDKTNEAIWFITDETLSSGTYDETKDEYTFVADKTSYEQIYVNAPDKTIIVELNDNIIIENNYNSPIYVSSCDKIEISAKKNKSITVNDNRSLITEESDSQGKGAIFVYDGDLKLKGAGTLNINAGYYNGIHCKDDVTIQKETLNISAPHHGVRGNDSITITSGTINISCGKDGLSTKNSDISSKGKQKGDVTINGGTITIDADGDALASAHDVVFEETDSTAPIVYTAKTGKYSSYSGSTPSIAENKFYLKMNSSIYSNGSYTYAAYINDEWYPATYAGFIEEKSEGGGGGWWGRPGPGGGGGGPQTTVTLYYKYEIDKPADATSFELYRFAGSVGEYSLTDYNAKSSKTTFNTSKDMVLVSSVSSKTITLGSWSNESDGTSAKGVKCENEIKILSGTLNLTCADDGLHANYDGALENGKLPLGNITVSGGLVNVASDDDGVHADNALYVTGGEISVSKSYEGIEAMIIDISGGKTVVIASDDGVNARSGQGTSSITVSGGVLVVTVPSSSDVDGIDSNGTYTQTGGIVVTRGPNSTNMAALDTDGTARIDGGTIIVLGALGEKGLTRGSGVSSYSLSLHSSGSQTVKINGETFTFNNSYSYSKTICYSSVSVTK